MNDSKTILPALAGWLVDIKDRVMNQPYVPHFLTKLQALIWLKKRTGATTVIEIGSYKGVTAKRSEVFAQLEIYFPLPGWAHAVVSDQIICVRTELTSGARQ